MAIPKMTEDVELISKLGDNPGSDNGLSAYGLRVMFDTAAMRIKNYINNTLVPELNNIVDVQALLNNILDTTLTKPDKAANAKATGDALKDKLDLAGGSMTGPLHVMEPTEDDHPTTRKYVDKLMQDSTLPFTVNLPVSGWTGSAAPYVQTVEVYGITASDNPHYTVVYTGDRGTKKTQKVSFGFIDELTTADNSVTFTCFDYKPDIDLVVRMEVNR